MIIDVDGNKAGWNFLVTFPSIDSLLKIGLERFHYSVTVFLTYLENERIAVFFLMFATITIITMCLCVHTVLFYHHPPSVFPLHWTSFSHTLPDVWTHPLPPPPPLCTKQNYGEISILVNS